MNSERAIAILVSMTQEQLAATADELDELVSLQLVAAIDPWVLKPMQTLRALFARYGGSEVGADAIWTRTWLQQAMQNLDAKLRSDFHRTVTSDGKLALEELERAEMRSALGLVSDPDARTLAQQTGWTLANVIAPGARMIPFPPDPAPLYAMTRLGQSVLEHGRPRLQRYGSVPVAELLKTVRRAEAKMQQLAEQIQTIDAGLGFVRKGRHQVLAGLVKSGLGAQQAVQAYQQAQQYTRRADGHPAEPPHMAVTLVRHACDTKNPAVAEQRLRAAEAALVRRGIPSGPQTRGAAKSLLGFQDLEAAASRFVELCRAVNPLIGSDPNVMRYAARLMPAQATPAELAQRCQAAAAVLIRAGFLRYPHVEGTAVALAAMARDAASVNAVAARFLEIVQALRPDEQWVGASAVEQGAMELTACPGTPQEVAATARALSTQLAAGSRTRQEAFELACSLAKRVAF
jgi:hypothetical protein